MSLNFIFGGSGRGKTTCAQQMMLKEAQEEPDRRFFYVVPEQFTLDTQRELLSFSACHGILNIEVQSFLRLAFRVLAETGADSKPILDDMGKTMILKKVYSGCEPELSYFGKKGEKNGVLQKIKSFLSEAMQYNVDADTFDKMIAASKGHAALERKLSDIKIIGKAFTDYLSKNYITTEEVMTLFCAATKDSALLKDSVVCFDGFTGFTPTQYLFLGELLPVAKRVSVCLTLDEKEPTLPVGQVHQLFYLSKKTVYRLREIARQKHVETEKEIRVEKRGNNTRFACAPGIEALEKNLFRSPAKPYEKKADDVAVYCLKNPESEVEFVAGQIKSLVEKGGYRYRDIAVVTADLKGYAVIAQDVFARANIPCFVDQSLSLPGKNAFVMLLNSALDLIIKDFERDAVMEWEKNPLLARDEDQVFLLDNFLRATGIRGRKSWQKTWESKNVFHSVSDEEKKHLDFSLDEIRTDTVAEMEDLAEKIGRGKHSVRDMVQALRDWMESQGFEEKVVSLAENFRQEQEIRLAGEYTQVCGIVLQVLDRLEELLGGEVMDLKEFQEILDTGLSEARIGLIPPGVDRVMFGDLNRTRLTHIKVLFFLGVNDKNLPANADGGGILSDAERQFLADSEFELAPTARENICTEKFYLYLSLTKPSDKLILTYGENDFSGKMQNPAYLIDRVTKIFPHNGVMTQESLTDERALLGIDRGKKFLTQNLRKRDLTDKKWQQTAAFYRADREREKTWQKLVDAAFTRQESTALSRAAVRALYGEVFTGSVSQFETYAKCAFSYFLKYGLCLKERAESQIEFIDLGNLVHDALMFYTKGLIAEGKDWTDISEDEQKERAKACLRQAQESGKNRPYTVTAREENLILRTQETLILSIQAITRQQAAGKFATKESEAKFLWPLGRNLALAGRVDRVDTAQDEEKLYLKVVDYKTGKKEFSLSDFYYGLQMQLMIYLNNSVENAKKTSKKPVVPAGAVYFQTDVPFVDRASLPDVIPGSDIEQELTKQQIFKEYMPNGLVNAESKVLPLFDQNFLTDHGLLKNSVTSDVVKAGTKADGGLSANSQVADAKTFELLLSYTQEKLQEIAGQITAGHIDINPYQEQTTAQEKKTACKYCPYQSICRFDPKAPGSEYRQLKKLKTAEVYQKIQDRLGGKDGNTQVDKGTTAGD